MENAKREIEYFTRKVEEFPDDAVAHSRLAKAAWYQGEVELAQKHASIAMSISPSLPEPYWILAAVMIFKKQNKEISFALAEKGYQLDPDSVEAKVVFANTCLGANTEQGIAMLEQAVQQEPENWWAQINLYYAYKTANYEEKASALIRRILKIHLTPFTINLLLQDFYATKKGRIINIFLSILYGISIILAIVFQIPWLMLFPIVWHSQLILVGYLQIRGKNKQGWKALSIGILIESIYFAIGWWIFTSSR
ncbi:MAG: hypothetical protein GYA36_16305 [Veillonellaceae bacterium]|nr:hypothetical protein [Veillonellaceae bacterium]